MKAILDFLSNFFVTGPDGVSPGLGTTEFMALVTAVVVLFQLHLSAAQQGALVTILVALYIAARSIVKALAAANKPQAPPAK